MNHTPGPWKKEPYNEYQPVTGPNRYWINMKQGCAAHFSEANATLICAAPDLLEALKATIIALEVISTHIPLGQTANAILNYAQDTVTKAKGD